MFLPGNKSPSRNGGSPKSPRSVTWNSNLPEKYSFTMRREFERAKEEADLIEQLRNVGTDSMTNGKLWIYHVYRVESSLCLSLSAHRDQIENGITGGYRTGVNGRRGALSLGQPRKTKISRQYTCSFSCCSEYPFRRSDSLFSLRSVSLSDVLAKSRCTEASTCSFAA